MKLPRSKKGMVTYLLTLALTLAIIFIQSDQTPLKIAKAPPAGREPIEGVTMPLVLGATEIDARVTRVIDGDTIEIETGEKVRLIGIDAPESVSPQKKDECFGAESSEYLRELLLNRQVTLKKDVSEQDSFKRLLRYVYLDGIFINEALVREGYAVSRTFPPDVKFQDTLKLAEREAILNKKGLWSDVCR